MKKRATIILTILLFSGIAFAQNGMITGKVIDSKTGKPLPFASVLVKNEFIATFTDKDGHYALEQLDSGNFFLEVSFLGFQPQTRLAELNQNDTLHVDFGLIPLSTELAEVFITSQKSDFMHEPMPTVKIEAKSIGRLAYTNTADLMEDIGGVTVARAGNWGSKPYIQGMTDSRVVMFIDGIKTTQSCPMGMDACSATIEPDMINSINVQVGPGSAQYGSGNMGGVINVSTIDPRYSYFDKFTADLDIVANYKSVSNTRSGALNFKGGNKTFDVSIGAGAGWHNNYKIPDASDYFLFPKKEIPYSGFNSKWLHINSRYRFIAGHQFSLFTQFYKGDSIGWPSRIPDTFTIIPNEKRNLFALKYEYESNSKHFKKLEASLSYQFMFHDMVNFVPNNTQFLGLSETDNYQVSFKGFFGFGKKHAVTAGVDVFIWQMNAKRQTATDSTQSPFVSILNQGLMYESGIYLLDRLTLNDRLSIDVGIRMNYVISDAVPTGEEVLSSNLKDQLVIWTGNIAPLYRINDHFALSAAVVKGYNAATPVDRFISAPMMDGFYHYGDPNLNAEVNISKRLGLRGMHNKWSWNLEYFHNSLDNLIERRIDSTIISPIPGLRGVKRSQNIVKGTITGASGYVSYYATPFLQISLTTSYLYGFDKNNNPLPNIAPFELNPKITYENLQKDIWMTLRMDIGSEQNRYANQYGEIYTPGYATLDFSGGWEVSEGINLSLGINNLTNRYYRKHLNQVQLPEPGLNVFASLKLTLPLFGSKHVKPRLRDANLVTLKVDGMACQFCAATVRDRSEALPQVIQSMVYLQDGKAEVIVGKHISLNELIEAIQRAGFQVEIISVTPYVPKGE